MPVFVDYNHNYNSNSNSTVATGNMSKQENNKLKKLPTYYVNNTTE